MSILLMAFILVAFVVAFWAVNTYVPPQPIRLIITLVLLGLLIIWIVSMLWPGGHPVILR